MNALPQQNGLKGLEKMQGGQRTNDICVINSLTGYRSSTGPGAKCRLGAGKWMFAGKVKKVSFNEFYEQNLGRLRAFVKSRTPNLEDLPDLTQKIFEIAWRRFDEYLDNPENELWVLRIAENVCKYERRKFARRRDLLQQRVNDPSVSKVFVKEGDNSQSPIEAQIMREEMMDALINAINKLPENLRSVFLMRIDEHTFTEIGYVLGISKQAARKRMELALQHISPALQDLLGF